MRKAKVYFKDLEAGILEENEDGYFFCYNDGYLDTPGCQPISLTMPLSAKKYKSKVLFPFFDGLIPEGWLLSVATKAANISALDRMSLLMLCCKDCIGAVSVEETNTIS